MRRVTIKNVAKRAGVSTATVSLALRDNPRIPATTRALVKRHATEIGYIYHRSAANLRTATSSIIGVAVPDLNNPAYAKVISAIEAALYDTGRMIFLANTMDSLERQDAFLRALREYGADGLIMCPAWETPASVPEDLGNSRLPMVTFAREVPGSEIDAVVNNDLRAFYDATRHLIDLGHRRIALVGCDKRISTGRARLAGYRRCLEDNGIGDDLDLVFDCSPTRLSGADVGSRFADLAEPPTAALCFGDVIAFGLMHALRAHGIEPGRDFAVVGCDDVEEASLFHPALTTITIDEDRFGRNSVELLLERIAEPSRPRQHIVLAPVLTVRRSCGATG